MKKRLSLLMVLMMVLSLVPMSVFATAGTTPGGLFSIEDTDENKEKAVTVKLTQANGTAFTTGAKAMLTLNKGEFKADSTVEFKGAPVGTVTKDTNFKDRAVLEITAIPADLAAIIKSGKLIDDADLFVSFVAFFEDRQDAGDVTLSVASVDVAGNDTEIDVAKPIVIGTVKEGTGDTMKVTVADSTKKVGFDGGALSEVTINDVDEHNTATNFVKTLELELPDSMEWATPGTGSTNTKVSLVGSATQPTVAVTGTDKNILTITFADKAQTEKTLVVKPYVSVDKRDASKGDIALKVRAYDDATTPSKKETVNVTVGQLADFDVTIKAWEVGKKEIPAMYGGDDAKVKVKLSGVANSFTAGRQIDFTVKGADVPFADIKAGKNMDQATVSYDKDGDTGNAEDGEFSIKVAAGTNLDELEFELKIDAKYAQNGAVTLVAESRDFGKLEAEIAKVTPAYTVDTKVTSIKKGETLATADIVIKEAKAGLLDTDAFIVLNLNDKNRDTLSFAKGYKVEATNDMKVKDELFDEDGKTRRGLNTLVLQVERSSSKEAATITLSNVMVAVDGATVDGEKVLATNIVKKDDLQNKKDRADAVTYVFATDAADKYKDAQDPDFEKAYVNVVKEYGAVATTTVFKIGSKEYTVNGESKTANEAPYVSGKGYTMLSVRAVAEALGLKADWNAATKTATFSNDSKVASVVIGSDVMYVNGTPIKLAAKAEIKNGSTFVELRSLASAFMVELEWDAATKSVTIKG